MGLRLPLRTPLRLCITRDRCIQMHFRLLHGYTLKTQDTCSSNEGLTYSYLTSSCGLSPAAALSVAQKFRLRNIEKADSFLSVLTEHGFTEAQIAQVITKAPSLLSSTAEKSIKPKLEFLLSVGLPSAALVKIVSGNPFLLRTSLERRLRTNFNILKTFLGGAKETITAVCRATRFLQHNLEEDVLPNVKTLEEHGVPRHRIVKLATLYPRALLRSPALFRKEAALLKEMGLDPHKATFVHGIVVFCGLNNQSKVRKLQLYRSLGWSEEDCTLLFKKFPFCLLFRMKESNE
ncbi:hypothetical protein HPP92_001704 [Vanilla planifolia]|uniref:Uncharacterized protein n=1 Tax=Vanilla planifolia TaxID=51239 RepID=A0A835S3X9_VANPL|nr:hypothetical protein HPP92_001704 [Vanilla planifolia]